MGPVESRANDRRAAIPKTGNYTAIGEDHPFAQLQSTDSAPIRSWSDTVSWVYTPNSNVVNEMRFGYSRVSFDFVNIDVNTPASTYGINTGITNPPYH